MFLNDPQQKIISWQACAVVSNHASFFPCESATSKSLDGLEDTYAYKFTIRNPPKPSLVSVLISIRIVGSSLSAFALDGLSPMHIAILPLSSQSRLRR